MEHQSYLDDEDEVVRKNNLDESSIDTTFLSLKIREIIQGKCTVEDEEFSWVNPTDYGLSLWAEFESPVPDAVIQYQDLCIPYQVYGFLTLQINLIVKLSRRPFIIPEVSLPYLLSIFENFTAQQQTFTSMLKSLHNEGFVLKDDYNASTALINPTARRLYIHWSKGFGRSDFRNRLHDFDDHLKHCILFYGGVLAELIFRKKRVVLVSDEGKPLKRDLGHAVVIVKWKKIKGQIHYLYLNSYGTKDGVEPYEGAPNKGFRWVKRHEIHHVYAPQLLRWFD